MFSNTLSFLFPHNVNDKVSHPYRTTGKTVVLYILIIKFLDSNLEDKRLKCYNTQLNTTRQSITQHLFCVQWCICQGDMFRPSRSSSGPPRKQIQELFSFSALWHSKRSIEIGICTTFAIPQCG
jgi:hypothetical protein